MQKSYFMNSNRPGNKIVQYSGYDFAERFKTFLTGVVKGVAEELFLSVNGSNMQTTLGTGRAEIEGYLYVHDNDGGKKTFTHDPADATLDRIDRVVIRLDLSIGDISAVVLKGTKAASPTVPALTKNSVIYEIAIAQVRITKGKSFIAQSQVKDERTWSDLMSTSGLYVKKKLEERKVPKFLNNWVEYISYAGTHHERFRYWKDDMGMVHMQGSAWEGSYGMGKAVLELEEGYRPAGSIFFVTYSMDGKPQFMELTSTGQLVFTGIFSSTSSSMIMGPVSFRPAGV